MAFALLGCGMRKFNYRVKKDAIRPHYQSVLKECTIESPTKLTDVEAAIEMGRLAFYLGSRYTATQGCPIESLGWGKRTRSIAT
jgi:hypothetical protein